MAVKPVTGDKEVIAALNAAPADLQKKALRPALRKASKDIVLVEAKRNLRDQQEGGTGALVKSLKVTAIERSRIKIGAGVQLKRQDSLLPFYALFQEFGLTKTAPPRRHKSGKSTGDLQARPYLRPALYDNRIKIGKLVAKGVRTWVKAYKGSGSAAAGKAVRAL